MACADSWHEGTGSGAEDKLARLSLRGWGRPHSSHPDWSIIVLSPLQEPPSRSAAWRRREAGFPFSFLPRLPLAGQHWMEERLGAATGPGDRESSQGEGPPPHPGAPSQLCPTPSQVVRLIQATGGGEAIGRESLSFAQAGGARAARNGFLELATALPGRMREQGEHSEGRTNEGKGLPCPHGRAGLSCPHRLAWCSQVPVPSADSSGSSPRTLAGHASHLTIRTCAALCPQLPLVLCHQQPPISSISIS